MAISIAVSLPIVLDGNSLFAHKIYSILAFSPSLQPPFDLAAIFHGQIYRLLTPMFIHFGMLHILFNMMCMKDFGRLIELRMGTSILLIIVVVTSIAANVAQYGFTGSPRFGGMSGVIYGFFGYLWMQQKFNPRFGIFVPKQTFVMIMVWFVLCAVGVIPHVANYAHGGGLVAGGILGYIDAKYHVLSFLMKSKGNR